jgi:hypothetical protein
MEAVSQPLSWYRIYEPRALGPKIIEGALKARAGERAARIKIEVVERLANAAAMRFIVPDDDEWRNGLDDLRHAESIRL